MSVQEDGIKMDEVYVGDKPIKAYLIPAMAHLNSKGCVTIKARGRNISRAIGVANRVKGNNKVDVEIGGEQIKKKVEGGNEIDVMTSVIRIKITKGG